MLKCPQCSNTTITIDSRDNGERIRRRHKCIVCAYRFTTYEVIEDHKIEKQLINQKVETYRKKYPADQRSDQAIIEAFYEVESRPIEDLFHFAVYMGGLVK